MTTRSQGADADVLAFPDLKAGQRKLLLGNEIGTQFDIGQRLFAYYGQGDVFDLPIMVNGPPGI